MKFFKLWLPVFTWCGVIFYLSGLPARALPVRLLDTISSYFGHFLEYMILGMLTMRAFAGSFSGQRGRNVLYAGSVSFLFAVSDEFHQSFVPTRFYSLGDILVDTLGIAFVLLLIFFWGKRAIH